VGCCLGSLVGVGCVGWGVGCVGWVWVVVVMVCVPLLVGLVVCCLGCGVCCPVPCPPWGAVPVGGTPLWWGTLLGVGLNVGRELGGCG
jgi:hypothetical protein